MSINEGSNFIPSRIVSPGIFTRETDLSGVAQGVADIGGAIVAPFPKGPAFTPTLVRSVADLEEKFGVADGVYYGPYTSKEYLIERGLVTVCRVGALTGYKQNYPFVIWAVKGTPVRNIEVGTLVSASSAFYPSAGTYADAYTGSFTYSSWIGSSSYNYGRDILSPNKTLVSTIAGISGSTAGPYVGINLIITSSLSITGSVTAKMGSDYGTASLSIPDLTGSLGSNTYYGQTIQFTNNIQQSLLSYYRLSSSMALTEVTGAAFTATLSMYAEQMPAFTAMDSSSAFVFSNNEYSSSFFDARAKYLEIWSGSLGNSGFISQSSLLRSINTNGSFSAYLSNPSVSSSVSPFLSSDNISIVSASIQNSIVQCGYPILNIRGYLSGSFGQFNGDFTKNTPTLDICTNQWTSSGADYRVLAVLADTQNATISDLIAPGFSGSLFFRGPQAGSLSQSLFVNNQSSSFSKEFAIQLKSSNSTTPYGVYAFSLDPASPKYITNVFGSSPTAGDPDTYAAGTKKEAAYLYKIYENQIATVMADNTKWYISASFLPNGESDFTGNPLDFTDTYSRDLNNGDSTFSVTNATTPWIISQAVASWDGTTAATRFRLFKLHTLSDGIYTNTSYKVEVSNVKLAGQVAGSDWGSFTLSIRKFSDTDKKPVILETFQNLNLDPNSSNYIARRIGDRYNYINFAGKIIEFGTYVNFSKYVRIEVATTPWPESAVPAGFEALITPINSSMGNWVVPIRYSRASIYGVNPGKYASGIAFNDAPTGADAELSTLYPTSSIGNGAANDNKQYFAPIPAFGAYPSIGRNVNFALDQTTANWGWDKPTSTGTYLAAALSGSVPYIYDAANESTYVKMRKFVVGFQGGFDGQSPAIPINIGSDIIPGNTQGLNCTNINSAGSIAYKQCLAALGNADEFDINLIAAPGIVHQHHSYVTNLIVDTIEARGDCFYIMDLYVTPETEGSVGQIDEAVSFAAQYDTNYAAAYYPWIKILDTNINKIITVPPSVVLPAIFASSDKVAAEWFAPAGLNRGGITQAVQVCDRTTHEERDTLYEGKVNPIAAFPGQGISVWGQKTLQNKASALDRINVRRLLINIKKFVSSTSKYLVFEQNVSSTRNKFLAIVNPYLESIQQRSGLYAFQVIMDETTNTPDVIDRNILYGKIALKPSKTAEFILIDFSILPTGAIFPTA